MLRRLHHLLRRRARDERGATAVETALVLPILLILCFGIIEGGLLFRNAHTITASVRSGARTAVALPRHDGYQEAAANAAAAALGSIPADAVDTLTIYRADPGTGRPVSGGFETCTTSCWRFTWDEGSRSFVPVLGTAWPAADQSACGDEAHTDYLGVYVRGHYDWVTGFFGDARDITANTVMRLEPLPLSVACHS
ncbi:MAG: TadE/TadG family type IV pilus assembly protein [Actinomycetota bacterium]|nr:TadE/TadG family type IV pilus assembly protein [Actinomycetota bacterium]